MGTPSFPQCNLGRSQPHAIDLELVQMAAVPAKRCLQDVVKIQQSRRFLNQNTAPDWRLRADDRRFQLINAPGHPIPPPLGSDSKNSSAMARHVDYADHHFGTRSHCAYGLFPPRRLQTTTVTLRSAAATMTAARPSPS